MALDNKWRIESFESVGGRVVETIENLIHEGNSRKISIRQGDSTVAEIPLTFGVIGAVLAPAVAAFGAIAALATDCKIEIVRTDPRPFGTTESDEASTPA